MFYFSSFFVKKSSSQKELIPNFLTRVGSGKVSDPTRLGLFESGSNPNIFSPKTMFFLPAAKRTGHRVRVVVVVGDVFKVKVNFFY